MSEENKARARRVFDEIINRGNLAAVDEVFADNFVNQPFGATGRAGASQLIEILRTVFPDIKATVEEQIAEGDKVVSRVTLRGTHEGASTIFGPLPPTGKPVTFSDIVIHRFEGGQIVEGYALLDLWGMMQQIGGIPRNK